MAERCVYGKWNCSTCEATYVYLGWPNILHLSKFGVERCCVCCHSTFRCVEKSSAATTVLSG